MVAEAEQLIAAREQQHPDNLDRAKELLLAELGSDNDGRVYTLLAEALFWRGEYAESKADKETFHEEGVKHGKDAVAALPDDVAANLWYAANMGSHGMARGIMSSLFYIKDIQKHGEKAVKADENFFFGAPLRLMGRFYHQAPGWPVGPGDTSKALKYLEKAVAAGPHFYLNHLYFAEALIAKRKKARAREMLDAIIEAPAPDDIPAYHASLQDQAKALLRKI